MNKLPANKDLRPRARELRKNATLSEVLLWNKLKNRQFCGLDFDRQKIVGNYIVDIYCPQLGLAIEIDGASHDWKGEYDLDRNNYLIGLGLYVLHIADIDVKQKMPEVLDRLQSAATRIKDGTAPAANTADWLA